MGEESEFLIRITGDAGSLVVAGKQGAGALEEVKEGITDGVNPALAALTGKTAEAGKASEAAEVSHQGLKSALRALGPEAQEAGHALTLGLTNPMMLGVVAVSLLAGKLIGDWKKVREAIEAEIELTPVYNLLRVLGQDGMLKAFIEGGVAAEEFWGKIERAAAAQRELKERTDEAVESIKKEADAQNKQLDEREKSALAIVDLQEKLGKLTAGQATAERQAIRDRFDQTRGINEQIAAERTIEARGGELESAKRIVGAGPEVVGEKRRAEESAEGTLAGLKDQRGAVAGFLTKQEEFLQEAGKNLPGEEYNKEVLKRTNAQIALASFDQDQIPQAAARLAAARAEREIAEKRVETATELQQQLEREIPNLKADLARANANRDAEGARQIRVGQSEGLKRLVELSKSPEEKAALEAQASAEWSKLSPRERANRYRALTPAEGVEAGAAAMGDVGSAVSTAQAFEAHKQTSSDQQRQLMEVASALAGHQVSFRQAVAMMAAAGKDIGLFTQDVFRLSGVMQQLATGHSALQNRVQSLEAKILQIKAQHRDTFNQ